jgi:3-oxoacyl-[acyl-carrier-protein] synthase III
MKIVGISHQYPSKVVTNADICEIIKNRSKFYEKENLDLSVKMVDRLFKLSGAKERRWLEHGEPWFPYVKRACENAMTDAQLSPGEIDCVIYCSIYKTVLEPSMSSLIGKSLGLLHASCFDVNEACGSWVRAVSFAQLLLKAGEYKKILLITNEAFANDICYGTGTLNFKSVQDLDWAFPSFTLGASVTATIFVDSSEDWKIRYGADNSFSDYVLLPLDWPTDIEHTIGEVSSKGQGANIFSCRGSALQNESIDYVSQFLNVDREALIDSDIFLPHTHSYTVYVTILKNIQVDIKPYPLFPKFGNIVTNSLPAGIADAISNGKIKRGSKVFMFMTASGLSLSTLSFIF